MYQTPPRPDSRHVVATPPIFKPTNPRPLSAARKRPGTSGKEKASWQTESFTYVEQIPHEAPPLTELSTPRQRLNEDVNLKHTQLEEQLTVKAFLSQPDRKALGYDDMVVRDICSSVVREIAGTVECLLDRLLLEKKYDCIRNMVAELMTEDIALTIKTGHEQLNDKQFGEVFRELLNQKRDVKDMATTWDQRHGVVKQLQDAQKAFQATFESSFGQLNAKLRHMEQELMPRSELSAAFKKTDERLGTLDRGLQDVELQSQDLCNSVSNLDKMVKAGATKAEMEKFNAFLRSELSDAAQQTALGLAKLQDHCASNAAVQNIRECLERRFDDRCDALQADVVKDEASIGRLEAELSSMGVMVGETFATKAALDKSISSLTEDVGAKLVDTANAVQALESRAASKQELAAERAFLERGQHVLQHDLERTSADLATAQHDLRHLGDYARDALATKDHVAMVIRDQVCSSIIEHGYEEQFQSIFRKIEQDRNRVSLVERQLNLTRNDRKAWQQETHNELTAFCKALQDNYNANVQMIHEEYFERTEHALMLHKTIEKIGAKHRGTFEPARNLKLPQVDS